jgi:hypothetical protein
MKKRILLPLMIILCFIGIVLFLNQNFTLPKSKDHFRDFRQSKIDGIVTFFDEGRGLKVKVDNSDKVLDFVPGTLVYSNKPYSQPICRLGDSLIKKSGSDTFIVKRKDDTFVFVLAP